MEKDFTNKARALNSIVRRGRIRTHLIMMDMTNAGHVNGVSRCVEILAESMARDNSFHVVWIRFCHNLSGKVQTRFLKGYTLVVFPLPEDISNFLRNKSVRLNYWKKTYEQIHSLLEGNTILHIHTLNLMEFALLIKKHISCKIVTHLHCLPWKGLYNTDFNRFNQLYELYYIKKDYHNPSLFIRQDYEYAAYTKSDCLVCVTECARDFIYRTCPEHTNLQVVTNGIRDLASHTIDKTYREAIRCVFVGNPNTSKGLWFVLTAMQGVLIQHPASLVIVGAIPNDMRNKILSKFPFLDIRFTGQVSFGQLIQIYSDCDIGLIGSVQEQCSYVAIEMMMMGLPVITTDVDGLDEIFTNGFNGFKVPVTFKAQVGLQVDVVKMSEAIVRLGKDVRLRRKMGDNARKTFLKRHSLKQMTERMKGIYKSMLS